MGSGTYTIANNLTIGDGTNAGATGATNNPDVNVGGALTVAANGTLTTGTGTITLSGTSTPLVVNGTFTASTSGTVNYTGDGASTVLATSYYNLGLKPGGASNQVLGSGTFTINNDLTIGNGTNAGVSASANNPTINLLGNLTIGTNATYTKGSGTTTFKKGGTQTLTDSTSSKQDLGIIRISSNSTNTTVNMGSSIKVTNVTIDASQTLDAVGATTLTVLGNWTDNGSLTARTGTVTFNGTGTQTIAGSSTFYNLSITTTSARTVQFTAGTTQSVASGGSINFTGAANNLLTLASTSSGNAWNLQANNGIASQTLQYLDVSDSNAGPAGTYAQLNADDATSHDSGNNTNWNFGATGNGFFVFF